MLGDVRDFNLRKTNRMQAVLIKLDDVEDIAKFYKIKPSVDLIRDAKKILSSNISKKNMTDNKDNTISVLSLTIKDDNKCREIIEELQEKYIKAGEYIIEKELKEEKDNLSKMYIEDAVKLMSADQILVYKNAIKSLSSLLKITKINKLNSQAFEISKDLKSCFDYENKIEKIKDGVIE